MAKGASRLHWVISGQTVMFPGQNNKQNTARQPFQFVNVNQYDYREILVQMLLDFLIRRQFDSLSGCNGRFIHTNIFYKSIQESISWSNPLLAIERELSLWLLEQCMAEHRMFAFHLTPLVTTTGLAGYHSWGRRKSKNISWLHGLK